MPALMAITVMRNRCKEKAGGVRQEGITVSLVATIAAAIIMISAQGIILKIVLITPSCHVGYVAE
jgi:hypothetical protein